MRFSSSSFFLFSGAGMDISGSELVVIPTSARGLSVLLIDHDTASLMHMASMLEKHSYRVTTTELASVALSMIWEREGQYDLVMADFNMPEMDGFMFLNQILRKGSTPIILMSSSPSMDIARKAISEGACFFFQKPVRTRGILNVWQHVFRNRRCPSMESPKADNEKQVSPGNNSHRGMIAKVDGMSKIACSNDFCGTKIQHLPTDIKGKSKQIECEVVIDREDHLREPQGISNGRLVSIENGKGELKRKRENDDKDGKRSKEKSDLKITEEEGKESREKKNVNVEKRPRMNWTSDLHLKFMEAISTLGETKAHPKAVLRLMNVPNLTHRHVASHLQKYRDRIKRISENCATNPPILTQSPFTFCGGYGAGVNMIRPWLNVGTSVQYNLETLKNHLKFANLTSNKAQNTYANYAGVESEKTRMPLIPIQIKQTGICSNGISNQNNGNGKGKQPLHFEGCTKNFSNDFQIGSSSSSASDIPSDLIFHGAKQKLNHTELMKLLEGDEFEDIHSLIADDIDRFSELIGPTPNFENGSPSKSVA